MKQYNYPTKVSFFKLIRNSSAFSKNPIPFHSEMFENTGGTFSIQSVFGPKVILTKDADIAKHILQKHHKKYEKSKLQTKYVSKYIGRGLLTATGDYWLQQRRLIQPGFHRDKIKNLVTIINTAIYEQIQGFKTGLFIDLFPLMNTLAFEVVARSLFTLSVDPQVLKRLQFIIERLQRFVVKEMRQPHKRIWYKLKGETAKHMKLVAESREVINAIIEERRASTTTHDDLLDMLLKAEYEDGSKMTNDQLIDEILILFVAGHETTANALTFTLFLLANHPSESEKAREESVDLRDSNNALEVLPQLQHIKRCVEESMRLYPSAWITDRVALEDDTFSGYNIKKRTLIGISIYEMHRNPKYWKNPEDFMPERFSEGKKHKAYIPFGAGPRMCIGSNFAMYEMQLAINAIVDTFAIETNKRNVQLNPLITLRPVDVEMKFTKRK